LFAPKTTFLTGFARFFLRAGIDLFDAETTAKSQFVARVKGVKG